MRENTGMMAVVPAWKLEDLVKDEELEAMREKARQRLGKGEGVELDSAKKPYSRDEFLADLRKTARKRTPPEQPSRSDGEKR